MDFQPKNDSTFPTGPAAGLSRNVGGGNGGSSDGVGSFQSGDGFRHSSNGDGGYGSFGGSHGQMHSDTNLSYQQFLTNGGGSTMNSMMTNGPMTGGSMAGNFNGGGGMNGMMTQGYGRMNSMMDSMSNAGMRNNFATSSMQQFGAGNSGMMSGQDRRRSSSSSIGGMSGMPSQATLNQMAEERLEKLQMIQRLRAQISQDKMGNYHQQSQMGGGFGGGGGAMGAGSTGNMRNMPDSYYAGMMAGFGTGVNANPSGATTSSQKNFPETLFDVVSASDRHGHIVSWLPHGQGFIIHDKQRFASQILPHYFDGAKFTSFTRRLKRWSYVRVPRGPELGAYYNKNFIRDRPELVQYMRYQNDQGVAEAKKEKKAAMEVGDDDVEEQDSVEDGAASGDEKGKDSDNVEEKEKDANKAGDDDGEVQDSDEGGKDMAEADTEVDNDSAATDAVAGVEKDDGNIATVTTDKGTVEAAESSQSKEEKSKDNKPPSTEPASSDKPKTPCVAEVVSIVSKINPRDRASLSEEQMRSMDNPSAAAPHLADNRTLEQNPFMRMMMDRIKPNAPMTGGVNYQPVAMPLRRGSLPGSMMSQRGDPNSFFPPHQYRKVSTGDISEGVSHRGSMLDYMPEGVSRRDSLLDSMMRRGSSSSMQMSKEDEEEFERFMFLKRKSFVDMERGGA